MMRSAKAAAFLAWREQVADRRATLCFALAFAAMLVPLLTLLSLKDGVIEAMMRSFLEDPSALELIPVGAGRYDAAFFAAIAAQPTVGFVTPRTRTISARLVGLRSPETRRVLRGPALIPTGAGDPVTRLPTPSFERRQIVLSAEAARELNVTTGARLEGWVTRDVGGTREVARATLTVSGVAPAETYGRVAIFAPFPLLLAVENFLDGAGEAGDGWIDSALAAPREAFASFRIYAASIRQVAAARDAAEAAGARVRARSDEIVSILQLEAALDWLFYVIATVAGAGFLLSLSASLRANVERLRSTLSMFRLMGADRTVRFLLPMAQAAIITGLGVLFAGFGYAIIAVLVEWRAAELMGGADALRLGPLTLLGLFAFLVTGTVAAAGLASLEAVRIGADEIIRKP